MKQKLEQRKATLDQLRKELWDAHQDVKSELAAIQHELSAIHFREQKSIKRQRMIEILQMKSKGLTDSEIGEKIGLSQARVFQVRKAAERLNESFNL